MLHGGQPLGRHLLVAAGVGVDTVAQVGRSTEACVLIDNEDRGCSVVQTGGPARNRGVEGCDRVVGTGDADRDYLGDLGKGGQ